MIGGWGDRQLLADRLDPKMMSGARRCSRPSPAWAVELRREENRGRSKDRARSAKLAVLLFQTLDPISLIGGRATGQTIINIGLSHLAPNRFNSAPQLVSYPFHRPLRRSQLLTELAHQPDRLSLIPSRIPPRPRFLFRSLNRHDPDPCFPSSGTSGIPRANQTVGFEVCVIVRRRRILGASPDRCVSSV